MIVINDNRRHVHGLTEQISIRFSCSSKMAKHVSFLCQVLEKQGSIELTWYSVPVDDYWWM